MEKIKEIIIIASGMSLSEGINLGLKEKIKDKFTIVCNYEFEFFPNHTLLTCCDRKFYKTDDLTKHPDIYERLKEEPLIVSTMKQKTNIIIHPNTILLKRNSGYSPTPLVNGFMTAMTGLFSLQLALVFEPEIIYLLGMDWGQLNPKDKTQSQIKEDIHHYGKEIIHRGSGKVGWFNHNNPDNYFKYFKTSKSKIYNISPQSNIQNFEKLEYTIMFGLLSNVVYNQNELREHIKHKLTER